LQQEPEPETRAASPLLLDDVAAHEHVCKRIRYGSLALREWDAAHCTNRYIVQWPHDLRSPSALENLDVQVLTAPRCSGDITLGL